MQHKSAPTWLMVCVALTLGLTAAGTLAGDAKGPRVVADFEQPDALTLNPIHAEAELVAAEGGRALQVTTQAKASWPGVLIKPNKGPWNLDTFDAVKMDIRNPQDVPVRVLLSINNPGADGRKHCNTESVRVPSRGQATLEVRFGMWHGESGHRIDLSNIVSVMVLLDQPGQSHRFVVDNIRAVRFDRSHMAAVFADPYFQQMKPLFGRGVNLGNALEAPREGAWGVVLRKEYFSLIKSAGFDWVRIPVRWSAHAASTPPYQIDPKFLARVDWAINEALKARLVPLVNMHHYDELMEQPDEHRERFVAIWRQLAEHYKDYPAALSFELLNEPHGNLTADAWNQIVRQTIRVVRRTNRVRKIVVGPAGWNGIGELDHLELPADDTHLIVTFHYYAPFSFTHQGAGWVGKQSQAWLGTKWLGTRSEKLAVARDLDRAIAWAVKHRRPIFLGEFGAYEKADMESRARWTRFVADEAMQRKIGFAYWEFCASFGVYDADEGRWVQPLKEALLPDAR